MLGECPYRDVTPLECKHPAWTHLHHAPKQPHWSALALSSWEDSHTVPVRASFPQVHALTFSSSTTLHGAELPHTCFEGDVPCTAMHRPSQTVSNWGTLQYHSTWTVSWHVVPASARCLLNSSLRYSPPQSDCKTLIAVQWPWVSAQALNCW